MLFNQIGAIEGQNAIKHNVKVDLSPQELVDCSKSYGNEGCYQGLIDYAFAYVKDYGLSTLDDYPYDALPETCKNQSNSGNIHMTGYKDVEHTEDQLKQAVGKQQYCRCVSTSISFV